jgi:DNA/RNA-binding domain of Phe-tRNA-synthetase-like protein
MSAFQYHPEILDRFPQIVGGVILARGMKNGPTPEALQEVYFDEQQAVIARIESTPLSELESLAAWRSAFRAFGVNPTKYRSAIEALLRRLTKKGDIPSINMVVDLVNMISIRHQMPVAAFDTRALNGAVTVGFAKGIERYKSLGQNEVQHPEAGEVIFADETDLVIARRWCWRQSDESATRPDTSDAIFTVETQHPGGRADVEAALDDLLTLLPEYVGGVFQSDILDVNNTAIAWKDAN